jgi:hypothetical protein
MLPDMSKDARRLRARRCFHGAPIMIPAGLVALFLTACPVGWSPVAPPRAQAYLPNGQLATVAVMGNWCVKSVDPAPAGN